MILMTTGFYNEPAGVYLVCVLYWPSRLVRPTNNRRSHAADEGPLWVEPNQLLRRADVCSAPMAAAQVTGTVSL
jgi:hypothetical protein